MYVHHPEKDYGATERVGSRVVSFAKGRAEVELPMLLRHYRRAGYAVTEGERRPGIAGHADPVQPPSGYVVSAASADAAEDGE